MGQVGSSGLPQQVSSLCLQHGSAAQGAATAADDQLQLGTASGWLVVSITFDNSNQVIQHPEYADAASKEVVKSLFQTESSNVDVSL